MSKKGKFLIMVMSYSVAKKTLLCVMTFCLGVLLAAIVCKMIVSDTYYAPVIQKVEGEQLSDTFSYVSRISQNSLTKLTLLLTSAFTVAAFPMSLMLSFYRGAAFGYCTAFVTGGGMLTANSDVVTVKNAACIFVLYLISSALMVLFAACAMSFSEKLYSNSICFSNTLQLLRVFLILSGAAVICEYGVVLMLSFFFSS